MWHALIVASSGGAMRSGIPERTGFFEKVKSSALVLLSLLSAAALAAGANGCGGDSSSRAPTPRQKPAVSGVVQGGTTGKGSAISSALVTIYQVGASGYSVGAIPLATTSSGKNGRFTVQQITCQTGGGNSQQLYLVATGGTPNGQSTANTAIALSAAIGPCDNLPASVTVNEATTVATAWALTQFTDVSGQNIGTSSTNQTGLSNAVAVLTAHDLIDLRTGLAPKSFSSGVTSPSAVLYTLANILAGCVNSAGANSTACQNLFTAATPSGGSAPATTLEAALAIARNPANNVGALYALLPVNPPFTPFLATAPDSWVLMLRYASASAGFNAPYELAVDALGNVWVVNAGNDSISELIATSGYTGAFNFSPAGAALSFPDSLALDASSNVWIANLQSNSVSELTAASRYSSGFSFSPSGAVFDGPIFLAIDAASNVWVANYSGDSVSELTAASSYATGLNFAPNGAAFDAPISLAVDSTGNVWVANYSGNSVSELTAASSYVTGLNFAPAGAVFNALISLALDGVGNVWTANNLGNGMSELTAASSYATGLNFAAVGAGFDQPISIAFDGAGNLWVANLAGNSVSELTASSGYVTGLNFAPNSAFESQFSLALDASGNVWIANNLGDSVSALIGLAVPVLTPIQACLIQGRNICTP
jgi:hypothetical protein